MFSGSRQEDVDILGMGPPWQVALCPRCHALTAPSPLTFNRMGGEARLDDHAMLSTGSIQGKPSEEQSGPTDAFPGPDPAACVFSGSGRNWPVLRSWSYLLLLGATFTHRDPFPEWEMQHNGSGGRLLPALDLEAWATAQAREPSLGSQDEQLMRHPAGSSLSSCSRPTTCTSLPPQHTAGALQVCVHDSGPRRRLLQG